uniref:3-oxo-5-alpha-steroid 4-dehydrogenase C-terminal domain-containing protein n=1 Tax=Branchiostoma floridae TaxID=7739 RepID=C3ZWC2_BRAFL|eukprot:XP_002587113.1 hypothetical protein BRAFLDRAFT_129984 [Branchiostoma floridae]
MFQLLPWTFAVDTIHFWVHYGLVCLGFLLGVITILVQLTKPAPYGKFDQVFFLYGTERHYINYVFLGLWQAHYIHRITLGGLFPNCLFSFLCADWISSSKYPDNYYYDPRFIIGLLLFVLGYIINKWADFKLRSLRRQKGVITILVQLTKPAPYGKFDQVFFLYGTERHYINYVFLGLWQAHYIHRITLGGLFPNCLFSFLCADWISSSKYPDNYYYDPRFIIGLLLFVLGYIINKWADFKLRSLRRQKGSNGYYIPSGGLFELVACPNYFGELVEWLGWYCEQFMEYPRARKALIPFVY